MSERFDKIYSRVDHYYGEGVPAEIVTRAADLLPQGSKIIDIGAGQGRNAIYLAERGFNVEAIDTSKIGIDQINEKGIPNLRADVADARSPIEGEYDMIVSAFVLHFLSREDGLNFISNIKEHTSSGGLNVISAFTKDGDLFRIDSPISKIDNFYLNPEELRELYKDWEIIEYKEEPASTRRISMDNILLTNTVAEIIARKPETPKE